MSDSFFTKKTLKKIFKWTTIFISIILVYFLYILFFPNIFPPKKTRTFLYIRENSQLKEVVDSLSKNTKVFDIYSFYVASKLLDYESHIKSGRYELQRGMNNFELIRKLRSGRQTPVLLVINNIRTKEELAHRLSMQLMVDSASIIQLLNDSTFLAEYGLNPYNSISIFIPNTYEVFWDISPEKLFARMYNEYNRFWNEERRKKAAAIPLTPLEVITLASIVEEETNVESERPIVAGVYINRLKKGMPLQADPTLKFAAGNFALRRISGIYLKIDSPYNTYKYKGLPPGPIRLPSQKSIDAVLNYTPHNYLYMCAKETLNGEHNFASNWKEHLQNAKKYQQALNRMGIFE